MGVVVPAEAVVAEGERRNDRDDQQYADGCNVCNVD
jgi:hypothetical protein